MPTPPPHHHLHEGVLQKAMPAIGYHCQARDPISRKAGRSAVAAAAYRAGLRLEDERTGKVQDYSRKRGVEFVWHSAPKDAPEWAQDIGRAWNAVEAHEDRINSRLAMDYDAAFPHQLNAEQREWMLKDWVREEFTRKGFMSTAAIHAPGKEGDQRNYHAHIMVYDRKIDGNGFASHKDREIIKKEFLLHAKEKWADLGARQLERAGYPLEAERWRHGHLKKPEQKALALARGDLEYAKECEGAPTKHLGVIATEIERDGRESDRGNVNRDLVSRHAEVADLDKELAAVQRQIAALSREPERIYEPDYRAAAKEQTRPTQSAEPEREHTPTPEPITEDLPTMTEVAATVERAVDTVENAAEQVLGAGLGVAENLANTVLDFFIPSGPPPAKTQAPASPEPPAWKKAKDGLERVDIGAVEEPQAQAKAQQFPRQTKAEMIEELRRRNEARAREDRERDDDDRERDRER